MKRLDEILSDSAVFSGLDARLLAEISKCGRLVQFGEGEMLVRSGGTANMIYVIRHGRVGIHVAAHGRSLLVGTVDEGDVVGWSALVPPYRWRFDAIASVPTRAVAFDAECLRRRCEGEPAIGYELMTRFAQLAVTRLEWTQEQLLDLYGRVGAR